MIQILCVHHITWSLVQKPDGGGLLMARKFDAKTIQMCTTVLITLHVLEGNCQVL